MSFSGYSHDSYGNIVDNSDVYTPNHSYESSSGRDGYGTPIYKKDRK